MPAWRRPAAAHHDETLQEAVQPATRLAERPFRSRASDAAKQACQLQLVAFVLLDDFNYIAASASALGHEAAKHVLEARRDTHTRLVG